VLAQGTQSSSWRTVPAHFYAFSDPEENVWEQIQRIKSHPWIPKHIPVRGFIYDVRSGRLREVRIATDTNAPWR
jgi:carbonic anhydrase